jgi:hypothetical protein
VGTGVPLLQPLTARSLKMPYPAYAALLAALALRASQDPPQSANLGNGL